MTHFEISSPFTQKIHIQIFSIINLFMVQQNNISRKASATFVSSVLINKKFLAVIADMQEPGKLRVFLLI